MSDIENKESKVAVRSIIFETLDDAINSVAEKDYAGMDDIELITCQTSLPKKVMLQLQGKNVVGLKEIPIPQFSLDCFVPVEGETDEQRAERMNLAAKTTALYDKFLQKEAIRLAKADCMPANMEAFLDVVTATRGGVEITTKETTEIITAWLRDNNRATKERTAADGKKRPIFFESANKLIECIKSQVYAMQVFAGTPEDLVVKLVDKFYAAVCAEFKARGKSTVVVDKWYNNRNVKAETATVELDVIDDLF